MLVTRILGDCPGCGGKNRFGNVSIRDNYVLRGCMSCKYSTKVWLPGIRKKIIYLDQFFFSHAFQGRDQRFARIYATQKDKVKRGAFINREKALEHLSGFFYDVTHVATYAPYCDAFIMDKAMAHLVADPRVGLEERYGVKVFSLNNWDELLTWLDTLEAGMTKEHKAGLSAAYS